MPAQLLADAVEAPLNVADLPASLRRDLRSDHAGEFGAVRIYRGILAVSRDPEVRAFATDHVETEARHLAFFESFLPQPFQTRGKPLWGIAGWLLGAVAAIAGRRGVWLTIAAVERFVVAHYQAQIDALEAIPGNEALRRQLIQFQRDEGEHRDDAGCRLNEPIAWPGRLWQAVIRFGSAAGVVIARWL